MSRRGRPRELLSSLPRLDPAVALDPALHGVQPRSRQAILSEQRRQRRLDKQADVARRLATQRGRRQIEELARACEHTKLSAAKAQEKYERIAAEKAQEVQRLNQLRVRVESGEQLDLSEADSRKLRRITGYGKKKPRLSESDHRVILELSGSEPQANIAQRLGTTQSTISRHLHRAEPTTERRGRKPVLTKEAIFAAASFQFICNTTALSHTAAFIKLAFHKNLTTKTVSKYLKNVAGFRLGDFRRFPRDRNSDRAIEERHKYATTMPTKYGQNTLNEAIYYDEMKLSRLTNRKAWSIGGWIPTVPDKFYSEHPEHISLLFAASPSFGILHFEVVEGSITAEVVLDFMKEMVAAYLRKFAVCEQIKRTFIMDNANMHHRSEVTEYLEGEAVAKYVVMEFLPIYSPFLNPLEEVFGTIKSRLWRGRSSATITAESKAMLKRRLAEVAIKITEHDVRQFYFHVEYFVRYAVDRVPVFTQQLYENSHGGDELGMCPLLPDTVEALLASYLPHTFEEFTPEMNQEVESAFGVQRLTMGAIADILEDRVPAQHDHGVVL